MSVREWLNNNQKVAIGITTAVVVLVACFIYASGGGGLGGPAPIRDLAFFTDDDGATRFADDAKKIPPFDHNGKQAVRVRVYRSGGKTYVNHLERYTAEAKKKLDEVRARAAGADVTLPDVGGLEVKAPGGGTWLSATSPQAAKVIAPRFPGGDLEIVLP